MEQQHYSEEVPDNCIDCLYYNSGRCPHLSDIKNAPCLFKETAEEYEEKIEYNRQKHPILYKIRKNIKRWITGFLIAFFAALLFSHYMFRVNQTVYLVSLISAIVFGVLCVICIVIFSFFNFGVFR